MTMTLLRCAAVLLMLSVCVCTDALLGNRDVQMRVQEQKRFRRSVANADDLCTQKAQAKDFCYTQPGGAFDNVKCSQKNVAAWLDLYNEQAQIQSNNDSTASWNYLTNITNETMAESNSVSEAVSEWFIQQQIVGLQYPVDKYDQRTKEELTRITTSNSLCNTAELSRLIELDSKLAEGYSSISACFNATLGKCLKGQAAFAAEMSKTEDYELLRDLWVQYTNGAKGFRTDFTNRLHLLNKGARENGFPDNGYYEWATDVGDKDFLDKMRALLKEIDPLYRQLHAYVRHKLALTYPGKFNPRGPIPVHLTRNMYGQSWSDLIKLVKPYPDVPDTDVTQQLEEQGYTTKRMFDMSDDFFNHLGFARMTQTFWNKSMLERPADGRTVECHGSAWDFQLDEDYRIKMCTIPTMSELITVHHEMGHVAYYMEYRKQRYLHRRGAQSGFHEAIGDTIALSVLTPEHLHMVGLLKDAPPTSKEYDINFLMTTALDKLPFFSFSLMMDLWRWETFNETIKPDQYNKQWWQKRLELGGIAPPTEENRNSEEYFDAGAKYHVTNNVPYIRYFMSHFLQFQFYEAMCNAKGYTGDLHRCDFDSSLPAGSLLRQLMAQGRSTNWHDQLYEMTGTREISSRSILRYFDKLYQWLKEENTKNNIPVGWEDAGSTTFPPTTTGAASRLMAPFTVLSALLIFLVRMFI